MLDQLPELGCELDGYFWGAEPSTLLVRDIAYDYGDLRVGDTPAPREDGVRFGRDYLDGQTVTISAVGLDRPGTTQLEKYGEFRAAWRAAGVRASSGGTCVLRMGRAGRTRRVYGRPRRWQPTLGEDSSGHTMLTAEFKCVDDLFYEDAERVVHTSFVQPAQGGFTFPATFPWSTLGVSVSQGVIRVGGDAPAWPCFKIAGPITRPVVDVLGQFRLGLDLTLQPGQWVGIDPRPWSRGVRSETGANLAPKLLPGSPQLSAVRLAPGGYQVVLRGQDSTGTAALTTAWRETYTGP